ncbi:hypothetical protein ACFL3M_02505 [Patescibacteria group bacterium]
MLNEREAHKRAADLKEKINIPKRFKKFYGKFSDLLVKIYFQKKNTGRKNSRDVKGFVFFDLKNHGQIVPLEAIPLEARSPREFSEKAKALAYEQTTLARILSP